MLWQLELKVGWARERVDRHWGPEALGQTINHNQISETASRLVEPRANAQSIAIPNVNVETNNNVGQIIVIIIVI